MRHVNRPERVVEEIPDQGPIANPERFRPEARLVRMPHVRVLDDGFGEYQTPSGRWERIHPMFLEVFKGLEAGEPFETYAARASEIGPRVTEGLHAGACPALCRKFLLKLWRRDIVDIPFAPPPDLFNGRYERIKELGRGGIGVVHLCKDMDDGGRLVTVKHPWAFRQPIERTARSLRKEARVLMDFDHPSIIRYLGSWEEDSLLHVVREYVEGEGLKRLVRVDEEDANRPLRITILKEIAKTVRHIHEKGYLFLDICPGNFILSKDDRPILIDIGLSRPHTDGKAKITYPIGSSGYASPEVIKRVGATFRSDVFGFGRLHYALLMGQAARKHATLDDTIPALRERGADEREIEVVARCSADRPEDRPADMGAVLDILNEL